MLPLVILFIRHCLFNQDQGLVMMEKEMRGEMKGDMGREIISKNHPFNHGKYFLTKESIRDCFYFFID